MRKLLHLSDLHFGRTDPVLLEPLLTLARRLQPDLVAVSGDLTQRARSAEFQAARQFLAALPTPQIVVPGNHDVPLYNIFQRFARPFSRYRRFITTDLQPFYADAELAVLGLNTARSLTIQGGRLNRAQLRQVQQRLRTAAPAAVKIIVTHHPFDVPPGQPDRIVGRATRAMAVLAECGADLFLAGHLHLSHTQHSTERYKIAGHNALLIQAGTAVSTRWRGEENSFNVLTLDTPYLTVERYAWQAAAQQFQPGGREVFRREPQGWERR